LAKLKLTEIIEHRRRGIWVTA